MEMNLSQLREGRIAKIKCVTGGFGLQSKILALGIRIGKNIRAKQFMEGGYCGSGKIRLFFVTLSRIL